MNVKNELLEIIQDYVEIDVNELNPDDSFRFATGLDSFALMALIAAIEEHFGIHIPNSDLPTFRTLEDIVTYVERAVA